MQCFQKRFLLHLIMVALFSAPYLQVDAQEQEIEIIQDDAQALPADVFMAQDAPSRKRMIALKRFALKQAFATHIDQIHRICELDSKQKKRLTVASKGVSESMAKAWIKEFEEVTGEVLPQNTSDEKQHPDVEPEIKSVDDFDPNDLEMLSLDVYYGDSSLASQPIQNPMWRKIIRRTLNEEQLQSLESYEQEQIRKLRRAQRESALSIVSHELRLSPEQVEEFRALAEPLIHEKKYSTGIYDIILPLATLSKIEDKDMKTILSKAQYERWKIFCAPLAMILEMQTAEEEVELVPEEEPVGEEDKGDKEEDGGAEDGNQDKAREVIFSSN